MNILYQISSGNNRIPSIPEAIRSKRLRLNMTQKELADACGLSKNGERTIRRWESGETSPSALELNQILSFPEQFIIGLERDRESGVQTGTCCDRIAGRRGRGEESRSRNHVLPT